MLQDSRPIPCTAGTCRQYIQSSRLAIAQQVAQKMNVHLDGGWTGFGMRESLIRRSLGDLSEPLFQEHTPMILTVGIYLFGGIEALSSYPKTLLGHYDCALITFIWNRHEFVFGRAPRRLGTT